MCGREIQPATVVVKASRWTVFGQQVFEWQADAQQVVQSSLVFDSGKTSQQHTSLSLLSLPRSPGQPLLQLRDTGLQQGLRWRDLRGRGHSSGDQSIVYTFQETQHCRIGRIGYQRVEANSSLR